ncbi:thymocyte selection-associated high mobility group box protein TOX isoform X1 [Lepisosteus oculatus]|uniref:thymocyte selection-associated high mobility group box protein TOX isoform X1 n=2 Tax=Lepisosteus oculatus TaxID=7918 RepID=UPI00074031FB|nr:PREDICTED: thymocyte selection-associated high mobility group box protein TOX isoform X1 [Lepisosteus oculatus]
MDVRFYPPPAQPASATDPSCLGPSHCLDPYYCNKFDGENMYMSMTEPSQDFMPASQFRVPDSPSQMQQNLKQTGPQGKRDVPSQVDYPRLSWSYPVPSLGDEDFNIPPITPPTLPDHTLVHMPHEPESGGYPSLCTSVSQNGLLPFHPQNMDLPAITVSNMLSQDGALLSNSLSMMQDMTNTESSRYNTHPQMEALRPRVQSVMLQHGQLTTINQSQLSAQLGLNMGGNNVPHSSPSPPGSKSATPSPSSSVHEDDADETSKFTENRYHALQMNGAEKRPATDIGKKPKTPKKKKKKDPNEPQKPVSAYALFFRDTQAAIKGQNPNATFGEVSKIVASMWDGLGEEQKQLYKKKTEAAKKEYLKQLAAYRASLVSKSYSEPVDVKTSQGSQMMNSKQQVFPGAAQSHSGMYMGSPYHQQPGMNPHLPAMHPNLPRSIAPKPNSQMPVTVSIANMAVSPTPPLQISPPLHQHLSLQQHQSITMQQQLGNHQLPLHSPSMQQGYPLQAEFQNIINSASSAGQVVPPSMDYIRSGCRNPPQQSVDWSNDYCGNGNLQRDKALYLT